MPLISCKNVGIKYDSVIAVREVSFDINEGDYVCVVGGNGSGKSTLMKGLLGLTEHSGEIVFTGVKRSEIGYMPQQTSVQRDFPAKVSEIVISGCLNRTSALFYGKESKECSLLNMKRLGIEHLSKKPYSELSRGQQQRVLIARALCASKKLLMLDEPVSGLDPQAASDTYELLYSLNKNEGVTIIMISHDIEGALKYGGKILHMNTSPLFFGTTSDYIGKSFASVISGGRSIA